MPEQSARGWTRVAFGEVIRLSRERSAAPASHGYDRYVGLEHIDPSDLKIRRWGQVGEGTTFTTVFRRGQTLFGKRRAYQRKVAVAEFDGVCSGDIYVLEPRDAKVLLPTLLPFLCQSEDFLTHAVGTSAGSLSPRTKWESLALYEFDLPPREEQARIASVLVFSSSQIDSLQNLNIRLSAVLGALVDDVAARATRSGSLVKLADLVQVDRPITYGILKPGLGVPQGVPVIKVKDFPEGYVLEKQLLLTDPQIAQEYRRSCLNAGDLLLSIRGTIGRLAVVPQSLAGANITQDTARLSIRPEHETRFIYSMLQSSLVRRQIVALTTGLAVRGIDIGAVRKLSIPMVDRARQEELVGEVGRVRDSLGRCKIQIDAAKRLHATALRGLLGARA